MILSNRRQCGPPDLVERNARRDREVEGIRAARLRDADEAVACLSEVIRQALLLVAHRQDDWPAGIVDGSPEWRYPSTRPGRY